MSPQVQRTHRATETPTLRIGSMYSGVGGMDYGAHVAGIETVFFCEADAWNRSILNRHWPGVPVFESDEQVTVESLRELGIGSIDILAGGPPCQPFSVAGKREGTADPRHRWPEMARIVAELRPAFVLVENVAGYDDVAEQLVRADLEGIGYRSVRFDIPAASTEAPHARARIFIVAYDDGGTATVADDAFIDRGGLSVREAAPIPVARRRGKRRGQRNDCAPAQSRLGGVLGRIADRMDAVRWPAPRLVWIDDDGKEWPLESPQYEWEPPRVTTERHERRKRLKALGNICVPWQVAPIFAAIGAGDDRGTTFLKEGVETNER